MRQIRICVGAIAFSLSFAQIAASAGPSEPASVDRKRSLLDMQAREGNTTLGALHDKGGLDALLRKLDFFSECDGFRDPLPIGADDFLMHSAKFIGGKLIELEEKKGGPAAGLIARVTLYEKINQAKFFLAAMDDPENRRTARAIVMGLTVNEFLEAVPVEIRHYDRVAKIACTLIGPELNAALGNARGDLPRINVRGFAFVKLKENWQQGYLTSSPSPDRTKRAGAMHIFPDNTLFNAPEEYVDDTIAALISHELIHGYQFQVNGVADFNSCTTGNSVISARKRSITTRLQLNADAWKLYERRRKGRIAAGTAIGAAVGVGVGAGLGVGLRVLTGGVGRGPTGVLGVLGAAAGANLAEVTSLRDLPSIEYEADAEGVVLACKRGYQVEGFRHLFINMDSGTGDVVPDLSGSQNKVIGSIDLAAEPKKYVDENCAYHPDTRLRWVNLMMSANALCPESTRRPKSWAAFKAGSAAADLARPLASDNAQTPATVQRAHGALGRRMSKFREGCLDSKQCIQMIVDNAATIIQTRGKAPEHASAGPDRALPPRPAGQTPPLSARYTAPPAAGQPGERLPGKTTVSNGYCDIAKMAGKWRGRYSNSGLLVPFELVLKAVHSAALTGESTEPDTRPGMSGTVAANWAGVLSAQGMVFERHYVVAPSVISHYYGYCNQANTIISGDWQLGDKLNGQFEMLKE